MVTPTLPTTQPVESPDSVQAIWGQPRQPAGCRQCRQAFLVDTSRIGQPCPVCGRGRLETQPALLRNEPPELAIPFQKNRKDLLPLLTRFVQGVWIHNDDFNPNDLASRAVPLFWPMWLVDSDLAASWQAEIGFDYQVQSSQESYTGSQWRSRQVVENRIRWEPRLGQLQRHYDNVMVPALSQHQRLTHLLGGYRQEAASAYRPEQIGSADVMVPDLNPESAWPAAQTGLTQAAGLECSRAADGQHIRSLSLQPAYDNLHWTQLLQPMFATYYTDDSGQPQIVYINAQSGVVGGPRLASQKKGWFYAGITAGVAALLLLVGLVCLALTAVFPPASILGILLIVGAFIAGVCAIIPAAWPWQWNRGQEERRVVSR